MAEKNNLLESVDGTASEPKLSFSERARQIREKAAKKGLKFSTFSADEVAEAELRTRLASEVEKKASRELYPHWQVDVILLALAIEHDTCVWTGNSKFLSLAETAGYGMRVCFIGDYQEGAVAQKLLAAGVPPRSPAK